MRFLADESCDFIVVRTLREAGQEVLAVSEVSPGAEDSQVIQMAIDQGRILLTEDKDFGQLVFAHAPQSSTVILIRYPSNARRALPKAILDLVTRLGALPTGRFAVLRPGRVRIVSHPGA